MNPKLGSVNKPEAVTLTDKINSSETNNEIKKSVLEELSTATKLLSTIKDSKLNGSSELYKKMKNKYDTLKKTMLEAVENDNKITQTETTKITAELNKLQGLSPETSSRSSSQQTEEPTSNKYTEIEDETSQIGELTDILSNNSEEGTQNAQKKLQDPIFRKAFIKEYENNYMKKNENYLNGTSLLNFFQYAQYLEEESVKETQETKKTKKIPKTSSRNNLEQTKKSISKKYEKELTDILSNNSDKDIQNAQERLQDQIFRKAFIEEYNKTYNGEKKSCPSNPIIGGLFEYAKILEQKDEIYSELGKRFPGELFAKLKKYIKGNDASKSMKIGYCALDYTLFLKNFNKEIKEYNKKNKNKKDFKKVEPIKGSKNIQDFLTSLSGLEILDSKEQNATKEIKILSNPNLTKEEKEELLKKNEEKNLELNEKQKEIFKNIELITEDNIDDILSAYDAGVHKNDIFSAIEDGEDLKVITSKTLAFKADTVDFTQIKEGETVTLFKTNSENYSLTPTNNNFTIEGEKGQVELTKNEINKITTKKGIDNLFTFNNSLQELGLSCIWKYRNTFFQGLKNSTGIGFDYLDANSISPGEFLKVLNYTAKNLGEKIKFNSIDAAVAHFRQIKKTGVIGNKKYPLESTLGKTPVENAFIARGIIDMGEMKESKLV